MDVLLILGWAAWGVFMGTIGTVIAPVALLAALGGGLILPETRAGVTAYLAVGFCLAAPAGFYVGAAWLDLWSLDPSSSADMVAEGVVGYAVGLAAAGVVLVLLGQWAAEKSRMAHALQLATRRATFGMNGYANYEDLGSKR